MCPESWKSKGDGKRPGPAGLSETVQPKQGVMTGLMTYVIATVSNPVCSRYQHQSQYQVRGRSTRSKSHFSGSLRPAWSLRFVRHGRTTAGCDRYEVAVHPAQTYCNRLFPVLWMSI